MCSKCDRLVELIEQTRDGKSVVVTSFPNGEPQLIQRKTESLPEGK